MAEQEQSRTSAADADQQTPSPASRQETAPQTAQNPTDTKPHDGKHSPDNAQVGTSDGDANKG